MAKKSQPKGEAEKVEKIDLVQLEEGIATLQIKGLTPVIPHNWSEKSKRMMPGHPERETVVKKKGPRNPKEEAEACLYRLPNGKPGMPATAFKSALVDACRFFDQPSMVQAKIMLFVEGEGPNQLVEMRGKLEMREDTPRNANGSADLRYRYMIVDWTATLKVRFVTKQITLNSVAALVDAAGRIGVGDWRPGSRKSNTGTFGTWRLAK